jgi:hypothetical protein
MSKQVMTNEELFKKLAEDLSDKVEMVEQDYNKIVDEVKADERYVNLKIEEIEQIARNKLITRKRREMNSPSITWEGVVLFKTDLIDGVKKQRLQTFEAYKKDPVKTLNESGWMFGGKLVSAKLGKLDSEGNPVVDSKGNVVEGEEVIPTYPKTDANDKWRRTGKPVPKNSWMRNIVGVASPIDKKTRKPGEPKVFTMTLNDEIAVNPKSIPSNVPVRFKGIDKTNSENQKANEYTIGYSKAYTSFETAPDLKLPPVETIINSVLADKIEVLGQLEEWHVKNYENFGKWLVVEATVSMINVTPNANKSLFMTLDDESLLFNTNEDGKTSTVVSYIPTDRGIEIDFGPDSRIYVFGKTSQSKKRDAQGNKTDEPGPVGLNVYGIYCPEMFKVIQDKQLSASSLDSVKAEETGETETSEEW